MLHKLASIEVVEGVCPNNIGDAVLKSVKPLVLRGLIKDWPAVVSALQSPKHVVNYIKQFYQGGNVNAAYGLEDGNKRVFYNDTVTGFTYERKQVRLDSVLDALEAGKDQDDARLLYADSTLIDKFLPGFRAQNDIGLDKFNPRVSLWSGNQTIVSAHHDIPDNIACVVAGRRRFVLFPPNQVENLYIGPLDCNPAGPAISMVDFNAPDFDVFPKYKTALEHAFVAELEPGDAIFIPSMWWHHVEGLSSFNLMVNYWWTAFPNFLGSPQDAFNHALMTIKSLPKDEREAWKSMFEYYVFDSDPARFTYVPKEKLGVLGEIDEIKARRLKAGLLNRLNR